MLVIKHGRASPARFEKCYPRALLLALSKSDKVACPAGMKPLTAWYGEYEPPSAHPTGHSGAHGHSESLLQGTSWVLRRLRLDRNSSLCLIPTPLLPPGNRRGERADRERGSYTHGERDRERERDRPDRSERERTTSTPATGQMGDFRLAGAKPYNTFSRDEGVGGSDRDRQIRRTNGRDNDRLLEPLEKEAHRERPWGPSSTSNSTSSFSREQGIGALGERRRNMGEFGKKDGRAAEEGGWRTEKEIREARERQLRGGDRYGSNGSSSNNNNNRISTGERTDRYGADRRRQPAWMDEEPQGPHTSSFNRHSNGTGHPSSHTFGETLPAWAADDNGKDNRGALDGSLEGPSTGKRNVKDLRGAGDGERPVDSIQAWKAEMKELERKRKAQEERELRKEMGLPELPTAEETAAAERASEWLGGPPSSVSHAQQTRAESVPPIRIDRRGQAEGSGSIEEVSVCRLPPAWTGGSGQQGRRGK